LTALVSHPFARKKAKGWGTGRLVSPTRNATAGPSTPLRFAQDDSMIFDDSMILDGSMILDDGVVFGDGIVFLR
jgi:hypothetical protein